ncbi:hypothetical protein I549_1932 [Mycobacterium avium subsp. avium 2285 (R)]|nr:hypothetical protein I549_1932 [Mycobacterium avium subsp. avium 2285 (R)]
MDLGKWWSLHTGHYAWVLGRHLAAAREGRLSPTWREDLITDTMKPIRSLRLPSGGGLSLDDIMAGKRRTMPPPAPPKPVPEVVLKSCVLGLREHDPCAELDADVVQACAALDVAHIPPAAWEPYAANGDWRTALDAWFAAASAALDDAAHAERVHRWAHPDRTSVGIEEYKLEQLSIEHDLLEVSYLAGIEAGTGVDSGWRDRLAQRLEHWGDSERREQYRLALLNHDTPRWPHAPSTARDADIENDPYRGVFGSAPPLPSLPTHPLPDYWRMPAR